MLAGVRWLGWSFGMERVDKERSEYLRNLNKQFLNFTIDDEV